MTLLMSSLLFIIVAGVVMVFGYRRYVIAGRVYENLDRAESGSLDQSGQPSGSLLVRVAAIIGARFPASTTTSAILRSKLLAAGYRRQDAVYMLFGMKLISMAALTLSMAVIEANSTAAPAMRMLGVLIGITAGFRLPDYFLGKKITVRKKRLGKALPDALDLIIVCAEAGLTLDRAFLIVAQQLGTVHRELGEEFGLFTAEVSAGLKRREALENLALRTQEPEIRKFASVLAQTDRFGTSMAEALRAHADYLRVLRRHQAEEKASKVSVKMIFPIFFFIMPCMLLVTVGPAVLIIMKQMVPALGGAR